ncbi:alpha-D-ribose 1-methylphosphonate 5-triphosphate diphosphatase [Paenibacillus sp. 598K]|uniref:alpha-D-ribose 1-methylphosphonate 5-triphosphate diphosphatase n=1 Tax=Paenibacillus sp. 598K TaxID=1117987 RepID=UPI000FFAB836|nr:alpha-D-ribose 1-methylphosphonate 5-triphosphate diphosphatase [Paenibacillus sp. 598K]GBF74997.1 alpha-D-ribose 1-methylphosphonate 5-triphosphate diphosphatase [Paenibacillus sp. 598K]
MNTKLYITNGTVVLPDRLAVADIALSGGRIEAILESEEDRASWLSQHEAGSYARLDAGGRYVLPGLVDIHCDAIEKEVQPRPGTLFPLEMAFLEFERKLPVHGITSMYHSLSLGVGLSLRGDHLLTRMIELIHRLRSRRALVRHGIHLRYEVAHLDGLPIVERFISERQVDYLSFMDHSPGQGQYREAGSFERYVMKNQGVTVDEVQEIVSDLLARQRRVDWSHLRDLGQLAARSGIAVASHDDDSPERVDEFAAFGIAVSEFPMNIETARHAAGRGLHVCVGAPNVVRGGSHDRNMSAVDAIRDGCARVLCSDYHPASLLAAVFKLADDGVVSLAEATAMASLYPAQALGAEAEVGSIETGKRADLLIVEQLDGYPMVSHTLVDGIVVYRSEPYYSA